MSAMQVGGNWRPFSPGEEGAPWCAMVRTMSGEIGMAGHVHWREGVWRQTVTFADGLLDIRRDQIEVAADGATEQTARLWYDAALDQHAHDADEERAFWDAKERRRQSEEKRQAVAPVEDLFAPDEDPFAMVDDEDPFASELEPMEVF